MSDLEAFHDFIPIQDAIFHYTTCKVASDHIIASMKFKLSHRTNANDPWEYKFDIMNSIEDTPPGEPEEPLPAVDAEIDRVLRKEYLIGSYCTNRRPLIVLEEEENVEDSYAIPEGWNKPRMWAQYGNQHRGACVVLSKSQLEATLRGLGLPMSYVQVGYVDYLCQNGKSWNSFTVDGNELRRIGPKEYAKVFVAKNARSILFAKHIDYRDEAEYRVAVYDPSNVSEFIDISPSLKGIIWGDRIPDSELSSLSDKCKSANIGCLRIYWSRGESVLLKC